MPWIITFFVLMCSRCCKEAFPLKTQTRRLFCMLSLQIYQIYIALQKKKRGLLLSFAHIDFEIMPGESVFCTLASGVAEQGKITKSIFHFSVLFSTKVSKNI